MPFIGTKEQLAFFVQNDNFHRCGTDINTNSERHGFTLFSFSASLPTSQAELQHSLLTAPAANS
jgi:hypothetical protein